jgi:hypothetical protein
VLHLLQPFRLATFLVIAALTSCGRAGSPLVPTNGENGASRKAPSGSTCTWSQVHSPNAGTGLGDSNDLNALATRSADDIWAAGDFYDYSAALYHTLTEHWNGRGWHVVPSLDVRTDQSELYGIAVTGEHEAFAVGYSQATSPIGPYYALIEHWNGHRWSIVQAHHRIGVLNAVAASGPDDVWAVGTTNYPGRGVIEHWNGRSWSYTRLRIAADFRAITAIAPDDVWAVGQRQSGYRTHDLTLTYHYDGTRWRHVPSPSPLDRYAEDQNWLTGISALASDDVWAFGVVRDTDYGILDQPLMEHWDGKRWRVVAVGPPVGRRYNSVWGGVALSASNVWAVGQYGIDTFQPYTLHWNGTAWLQMPAPQQSDANLLAAAVDGSGGLWAVGDTAIKQYTIGTLALHCRT